ncbi:MAG: ligase 1 [Thermoplasmata archaeon]|nr:ligase 1 [Thermoplasmata archaeon]
MDYARLCEFYERLEATTKRLEMTDILVELAREADGDLRAVVYLTRGQLAADFVGLELGVAEKLVMRALHESTGVPEDELTKAYHKAGDLGDAAFELLSQKKRRARQATLFAEEAAEQGSMPVAEVFARLHDIAESSGSGSQGAKMALLQKLLARCSPREARYLVRTVTGKLRLGIADMTILDALAAAFATKEYRPDLERAYNVCSDLGLVADVLLRKGLAGVEEIRAQVGVPMRAMLAERLPTPQEILEKLGGEGLCELKYDGLRLQAHIPAAGKVRFYSRRLEDMTKQFPDVADSLRQAFSGREAIVEGEVVAIDPHTGDMRPFQEVAKRRGRKNVQEVIDEVPVTLFLFDCLLLDGEDLTQQPLPVRRAALERSFDRKATRDEQGVERIQFSRAKRVASAEEVMAFFEQSVAEGAEGIMVKSVQDDSTYKAGSRGYQWIKFKREYSSELQDSLDLVVVGAIAGRGRRAGWYGALIMASYNPEEDVFESICKLGTGFDDAALQAFTDELKSYPHEGGPHPRVRAKIAADAWFAPVKVLEVVGAELTLSPLHTAGWGALKEGAGISVRFPRFTGKVRDDKKPEEATTVDELISMFKQQGHKPIAEADEA